MLEYVCVSVDEQRVVLSRLNYTLTQLVNVRALNPSKNVHSGLHDGARDIELDGVTIWHSYLIWLVLGLDVVSLDDHRLRDIN